MSIKKQFGNNVQRYRKLKKLTQEKLAELVGLDPTSISSIETGKFFPTIDNVKKISEALDINLETLFHFEDEFEEQKIYNEVVSIVEKFKSDKIKLTATRNFVRSLV